MNSLDFSVFVSLFRQACLKCFGHPLEEPLSETESKLLYNKIFDQTGLTIGWKSLKNYSIYILAGTGKQENPSTATLDTLARYVLDAAETTEPDRKEREPHFPYWYRYMEEFLRKAPEVLPEKARSPRRWVGASIVFVLLAAAIILLTWFYRSGSPVHFVEDFHTVQEDSLKANGWSVQARDSAYWKLRAQNPGALTLYTLQGDNWPDPASSGPVIHNLLLHELPCDCWTLEVHLQDFIPRQNWQQAGILLLEDTSLSGRSMRVSFAYNDYNGVYPRSGTILIQAITSQGNGLDKPEEIAHVVLFHTDSLQQDTMLSQSLAHSALRIEHRGGRSRILYADGVSENTSFREVANNEFGMKPRYAGLFALRGFVDSVEAMPAQFRFFSLHCEACSKP